MGTWGLVQIGVDIFLALGIFVVVAKLSRAPQDDPRLSKGLQLLQSKIAVLEDLSDRTETQVQQLVQLLEQKGKDVQAKIQLAEKQIQQIRLSMDRSLEVAKIFQDKIPHQEIIERQNTLKYIQAARMAHQGLSADEISKVVDLPLGEIEFIAKVNKEKLTFNEDELPLWAKVELKNLDSQHSSAGVGESDMHVLGASSEIFDIPNPSTRMAMLGAEFRRACHEMEGVQNANQHAPEARPLTSQFAQAQAPAQPGHQFTAQFSVAEQAPVHSLNQFSAAQQVPLNLDAGASSGLGQELQETIVALQRLAGTAGLSSSKVQPEAPIQTRAETKVEMASPPAAVVKKPVHVVSNRGEPVVQTVRFPRIEKPVV